MDDFFDLIIYDPVIHQACPREPWLTYQNYLGETIDTPHCLSKRITNGVHNDREVEEVETQKISSKRCPEKAVTRNSASTLENGSFEINIALYAKYLQSFADP